MALTRIRGEQIHSRQIKRHHIIDTTDGGDINDTLIYSQMDLSSSIVASDLDDTGVSGNAPAGTSSVHGAVLDSRLIALWDTVTNKSVTGQSQDVSADVQSAAATDTSTSDFSTKGILLTGTGTNGAGIENYKVNIRDANTKKPIDDGTGAAVYGELTESGGVYTLNFEDSSGSPFTLAVQQQESVFTTAEDADGTLNNKYFFFETPDNSYYVWFNVDAGGTDPALPGLTGVEVALTAADTADAVATAVRGAIDALTDASAGGTTNEVVITAASNGRVVGPTDGSGVAETGFSFDVSTYGVTGSIDYMFREVYSYLDAPADAFVTGMGFADIVGVSGTHNHNDLYYTKIDLESGQLDDRYATRSDLNGGLLDSRYYTETELDPLATQGSNVLDARYFTEDELTSNTDGSSGADLLGVTPYTAAGGEQLSANTVQGAFEELQNDIDGIINGNLDITQSLDDAYDDGSVVTVDTTAVDWQLADTMSFLVSDGTTALLDVTVDATGGNSVSVANGDFDVTGASTFTGTLSQSGGAVTLNAGANAVDVDAATFNIDGTSNSAVTVTGADVSLRTQTSGNVNLTSAGEIFFNDSHLGAAIAMSDAGNTALSSNFDTATTILGAINENVDDLYELINTTLPSTIDGSAGADQIGVTGITGVIPGGSGSGNSVGDAGTVQEMLEGLAQSAGGVKTYADETAFASAKAGGVEYLPADTMFYVKDTDRFGIVLVEGTTTVEGTDWDYLWGANQPMAGNDFVVTSDSVSVDTTGSMTVATDTGFSLDDDSGAHIAATTAGQVDVDSAAGQIVDITSDTEVSIDGGALVDVDGTAITIDGQLTATGATDDNMQIVATGAGQVQLTSSQEIDLNAPTIDVHGDIVMDATMELSTDHINITSVDPSDFATISGYREGTVNTANLLTNSGFEDGSGGDATAWTESYGGRTDVAKYYGDWAMGVTGTETTVDQNIVTQALTGLTVGTHILSFYARGNNTGMPIKATLNGGTEVEVVPAGSLTSSFQRFTVDITPATADGNLSLDFTDNGGVTTFFIDAVMLEEGTGAASAYFSDYESTLQFHIGSDANDKILFTSTDGTTQSDLMRINQTTVEIMGDLLVSGTTTQVDSTTVNIADNVLTLNSNVTGAPSLDAQLAVERGDSANTSIRWNESTDQWELTNDGTTYAAIATGASELSMDTAYDGGSTVTVDDTSVVWQLSTGNFQITDATDGSKFVVSAGTAADSVLVDTSGGMTVNVDAGFFLNEDSGASVSMDASGAVAVSGASNQNVSVVSTGTGETSLNSSNQTNIFSGGTSAAAVYVRTLSGGVDIDAALGLTADAAGISLDSTAASNFTVDGASLTLSTSTSGNVALSSAADVTFNDQYQTAARSFSQTAADGFAPEFGYDQQTDFDWTVRSTGMDAITSLMGGINANRQDLYEYVELTSTQGATASGGTAAGANLIGAGGITGVTPTGGTEGAAGTVQAMMEGLALAGGGGKTYADETAFTTAKAAGDYFKANEHVWILDSNRQVRVLVQGTSTVEGTDWDYVADTNQALGGGSYQFNLTDATADSFSVTTAGGVDVSASGALALDGVGASNLTTDSGNLTLSTTTSGNVNLTSVGNVVASGNTIDIDGSLVTVDSTGAISLDAAAASNFSVDGASANLTLSTADTATTSPGNVVINSGADVNMTATDVDVDSATLNIDTTGAFSIDGAAASNITVSGANLLFEVTTSGELQFKDTRQTTAMPLTDASNASFDYDPAEAAPASIYDAINRAYNNTGDTSRKAYQEVTATATTVSNDYVELTGMAVNLPGADGSGSVEYVPSGLRSGIGGTKYFIAIYLNGLRLNDSEWVYWYDDVDKRHMVSFMTDASSYGGSATFTTSTSSDVTLVTGDVITVDVTVNEASNV